MVSNFFIVRWQKNRKKNFEMLHNVLQIGDVAEFEKPNYL